MLKCIYGSGVKIKKNLTKADNNICIVKYYNKFMLTNYSIECPDDRETIPIDCINYGIYADEKRALEVLDDIQELLKGTVYRYTKDYVYEMPKE